MLHRNRLGLLSIFFTLITASPAVAQDIPDSICPPLSPETLAIIEAQADLEETTLVEDFTDLGGMFGFGMQFVIPDDYEYLGEMTYLSPDDTLSVELAVFNGGGLRLDHKSEPLLQDAVLRVFVLLSAAHGTGLLWG